MEDNHDNCDCDCERRETIVKDPSEADKYHTCEFCQTIIIDPSQMHHPITGEKAPEGYCFVQPTLSSTYASRFSCLFAKWLFREWDRNDKSLRKHASWRDMLPRGPTIRLCVYWKSDPGDHIYEHVSTEELISHGLISVRFFGLWDPELDWWDEERDNGYGFYPGRCEVGTFHAFHALDSFVFEDDPISGLVYTRPINTDPGSKNTFAFVRRWIENCRENHPGCPTSSEHFMPEILVKIGAATLQDEEYQVALECPADSKSSTRPYLALSYCWGGDQTHKTTRCQIAAADFDLEWTALPASIQDAVKVTANLGFEYLWVDSLCIIQDDPVQKARQMAQMCEVYENAALTIRACKAKRAVDGFLHHIDLENVFDVAVKLSYRMILPPDFVSLQIPNEFSYEDLVKYLTWSPDDKFAESEELAGSIYICCVSNQTGPNNCDSWDLSRYQVEPIDFRGWTLQERYLSARSLDFCRRQIRWRCPAVNTCHPPTDGWQLRNGGQDRETIHTIVTPSNSPWAMWDKFYRLVREYTGRELSVPRDRILAISGIAEKFRSLLRDEYLAGLWRQSLPYTLLWSVNEHGQEWRHHRHRPAEFQGPSWSWTAVNDQVSFWKARVGGSCMQISNPKPWPNVPSTILSVDATIELEDEGSPLGMVRSGTITGSGRIYRAVWFLSGQPKFHIRLHSVETDPPEGELGQEGNWGRHNVYRQIRGLLMYPDAIEKEMDGITETSFQENENENSCGSGSGESEPAEPERGQFGRDEGGETEDYSEVTGSYTELVKPEGACLEVFLLEVDVQGSPEREYLYGLVLRKIQLPRNLDSKGVVSNSDTPDSVKTPLFSRLGTFCIDGGDVDTKVDELFGGCSPAIFKII